MINGNQQHPFLWWNGGSAFLENKIVELENIIKKHKPAVFGICEANLRLETDVCEVNIENYELLTVRAMQNQQIKMSRIVVYIRKDVQYIRRENLENDVDSAIWLDVKFKGGKK